MFHSASFEYCLLCQKKKSNGLFLFFLDQIFVILLSPEKIGISQFFFEPNNISLLNFIGVALLYYISLFSFNCVMQFFSLIFATISQISSPSGGDKGGFICQCLVSPNQVFPSSQPNLPTCFLLPCDRVLINLKTLANEI